MPNGYYEPIVKLVLEKAAKTGMDSLDPKEMTLLLASEMHTHSIQAKTNQEEIKEILASLRRPFWKMWTYREKATAASVGLALLSVVNWDKVISLLTAVASAAGR